MKGLNLNKEELERVWLWFEMYEVECFKSKEDKEVSEKIKKYLKIK